MALKLIPWKEYYTYTCVNVSIYEWCSALITFYDSRLQALHGSKAVFKSLDKLIRSTR